MATTTTAYTNTHPHPGVIFERPGARLQNLTKKTAQVVGSVILGVLATFFLTSGLSTFWVWHDSDFDSPTVVAFVFLGLGVAALVGCIMLCKRCCRSADSPGQVFSTAGQPARYHMVQSNPGGFVQPPGPYTPAQVTGYSVGGPEGGKGYAQGPQYPPQTQQYLPQQGPSQYPVHQYQPDQTPPQFVPGQLPGQYPPTSQPQYAPQPGALPPVSQPPYAPQPGPLPPVGQPPYAPQPDAPVFDEYMPPPPYAPSAEPSPYPYKQ